MLQNRLDEQMNEEKEESVFCEPNTGEDVSMNSGPGMEQTSNVGTARYIWSASSNALGYRHSPNPNPGPNPSLVLIVPHILFVFAIQVYGTRGAGRMGSTLQIGR